MTPTPQSPHRLRSSVVVCTRNRAASLLRTVRSVLQSAGDFELLVIDQSDDSTAEAVLAVLDDSRLRYVRSGRCGKGAALNDGLRLATGDVVVCTDDDCEVPAGWAADMTAVMAAHPRAAVVFCNVLPPDYDRTTGYIPAYERTEDRRLSSIVEARRGLGLGAGMALRREAVLAFGGFDEAFGPGSRFASGDDWDISLRAMLRGWEVYDTAQLAILHYGFRTFEEGRGHALRDWISIGALCAKPIRAGYAGGLVLAGWLFGVEALWPPVRDVLRLRKPGGLSRIIGFARGFTGGLRTAVDGRTLMFRPVPSLQTPRAMAAAHADHSRK
jgi:glycosyltransferase involved in cell wall biosynthesis